MALKIVTIRRNADNTITIRVGNMREHVSMENKSKGEIFDAVKWACVSKDVHLTDIELTELLQEVMQ